MNVHGIGSLLYKAFSQGIGVGVKAPAVNSLQLSNVLGRVGNSSATSPAAQLARGASGVGNGSAGIVEHLSGVRGEGVNPASLNIPPMAQRGAAAYYNASMSKGANLTPSDASRNVIPSGNMDGENVNTTQNKNEYCGELPPIAKQLMAEIAKHEERKSNNGSVEQNSNLPPIAKQLMAEIARHEAGKNNRGPIAPDSPMGKEYGF